MNHDHYSTYNYNQSPAFSRLSLWSVIRACPERRVMYWGCGSVDSIIGYFYNGSKLYEILLLSFVRCH